MSHRDSKESFAELEGNTMIEFGQKEKAFKFGAGRCLIAADASKETGEEVIRLKCKRAYIIAGNTAFSKAGDNVCCSLERNEVDYKVHIYNGYCTVLDAQRIASEALEFGADVVIGIGGGKVLDVSKLIAHFAKCRVITIPTISATSAAFTHMSVMYNLDGTWDGTWFYSREVDCVIADTGYLCKQPKRFMYAGALDAMAKWVEISHRRRTTESIIGEVLLAKAVAEHVYTRLSYLLPMSIMHDSDDTNCEIAFLSIFGAALVSGIARCEQQSAIGHAFYEWTKRYYASSVQNVLHGEIVGVGLLIQSWYNRNNEMRQQISRLLTMLHMPISLPNLGITDEGAYAGFTKWLCSNKELVPDITEDELYGFMIKDMR